MSDGDVPAASAANDGLTPTQARIDAARVLQALGAIGYTPDTAICDIVDNAVSHGAATEVSIALVTQPGMGESRRNSAAEYVVADNGAGMDEARLADALALGSPYTEDDGPLGKFGLGLKSAGLSLGRRIIVLSKTVGADMHKNVLDLAHVESAGEYQTLAGAPNANDLELWEQLLGDAASGTLVRVAEVHRGNQPSIKSTRLELERRLGVIYFYFIRDSGLTMRLNGNEVTAFDPLFTAEAASNGDIDEAEWDGRSVRWLARPHNLTIDAARGVQVQVEMTQLPHPRVHDDQQAAVRQQYNIGAGNYGFYVYRNNRLISWAERFTDIIPLDQDYYAFRGRIHISQEADDVLNIDVKKSRVMLSEEAREALSDDAYEPRRASKAAWKAAFRSWKKAQGDTAQAKVNENLNKSDEPEDLPSEPDDPELQDRKTARSEEQAAAHALSTEERDRLLAADERITIKEFLEDNVVWQRAYDPTHGTIVRLNRSHRFMRHVFAEYADNFEISLILNAMFLCLARTETYLVTHLDVSSEQLESIFERSRHVFSETLGGLTQEILEPALSDDTANE